jgi:hypothetical protein
MTRYVLTREHNPTYKGPVSTAEQIGRLPHVHIIDQTGDLVLLVEATPEAIHRHKKSLRGWKVSPEVVYAPPWGSDPRWR